MPDAVLDSMCHTEFSRSTNLVVREVHIAQVQTMPGQPTEGHELRHRGSRGNDEDVVSPKSGCHSLEKVTGKRVRNHVGSRTVR